MRGARITCIFYQPRLDLGIICIFFGYYLDIMWIWIWDLRIFWILDLDFGVRIWMLGPKNRLWAPKDGLWGPKDGLCVPKDGFGVQKIDLGSKRWRFGSKS